jgi:hypothetical protein
MFFDFNGNRKVVPVKIYLSVLLNLKSPIDHDSGLNLMILQDNLQLQALQIVHQPMFRE